MYKNSEMKKISILIITLVITQTLDAQILSYGLKGGANYTYWHQNGGASPSDDLYQTTTNAEYGFEIGLVARQLLSKNTSLNEEFIYTTRTSSVKAKRSGDCAPTMKNAFITVPIFISYNAFKKFNLDAGVQYSRIIKHTSLDGLPQGEFENLNLGSIILGLGYDLTKRFNINVRYNYTFKRIPKQALLATNANIFDEGTFSPRSFNLAVSYYFD
jgi:predicted porin